MQNTLFKLTAMLLSVFVFGHIALVSVQAQSGSTATRPQSGSSSSSTSGSMKKSKMVEANHNAQSGPFAFIELFTSEGCSSCPSADRNLERIAREAKASGKNVYTLSYHVDYWDNLGWKDPYGSKSFTNRQNEYARQFESNRVYTPQMVVNGQVEFVGSNQKNSDRAVELAMKINPKATVKVDATIVNGKVKVQWQATGNNPSDTVRIALVQNHGKQKVTRGENARRDLTHVNIVRGLKSAGRSARNGQLEFDVPQGFTNNGYHVVGFIQTAKSVSAVSRAKIKTSAANGSSKKTSMYRVQRLDRMFTSAQKDSSRQLVKIEKFLDLLIGDQRISISNLQEINNNWDMSYVPMLLEVARFLPRTPRSKIMSLLELKTGQKFGFDNNKWLQWNWAQKYTPHPNYGEFKSQVYRKIDPRFSEYFQQTNGSKIRLDEIRWGGVARDGIPPLKNPEMTTAVGATYLSDTDVVFGIELNGDTRAYPKRILAWHEMFKDTIGGQSVCGVY